MGFILRYFFSGVEEELAVFSTSLDNTVSSLTNTQRRLDSAHLELATTARKLLPGSPGFSAGFSNSPREVDSYSRHINGGISSRGQARSTSSSPPGANGTRGSPPSISGIRGDRQGGSSYSFVNARDNGSNSSVDKVIYTYI